MKAFYELILALFFSGILVTYVVMDCVTGPTQNGVGVVVATGKYATSNTLYAVVKIGVTQECIDTCDYVLWHQLHPGTTVKVYRRFGGLSGSVSRWCMKEVQE